MLTIPSPRHPSASPFVGGPPNPYSSPFLSPYPSPRHAATNSLRSLPEDRRPEAASDSFADRRISTNTARFGAIGSDSFSNACPPPSDYDVRLQTSGDMNLLEDGSHTGWMASDFTGEGSPARGLPATHRGQGRVSSQRRPSNRDEFDGPHQFLDRPSAEVIAAQERKLLDLPINLHANEQDEILSQVNDRLSMCAFDFVAKYQFPIPLEPDKRPVRVPGDREWTEWVYLLKRLATKRRVPARLLYNGQIRQLVTVLENSLEMRHAAKHQSRPVKDDRNVLQLISAGLQVSRILKDACAMEFLDRLYVQTERTIQLRRSSMGGGPGMMEGLPPPLVGGLLGHRPVG